MAAQIAHDVVKEAQSVGAQSSIGDIANSTSPAPAESGLKLPNQDQPVQVSTEVKSNLQDDQSPQEKTSGPARDLAKSPFGDRLAEASGGSDTDTSKPDASGGKDGAAGHARSNSVKKPTSFKSVSVTKNFLAKAAVSTPSARPGEKVLLPGQSSSSNSLKPRLVAKSGSGLSSRSGAGGSGIGAGGPDASSVWNKNRPVAQNPRQFTDEELKQQYGIHMATRLPADESGKESKWADMDDDEEDWAPESMTWMDGTKSTVAAMAAAKAEEELKQQQQKETVAEPPKPPVAEPSAQPEAPPAPAQPPKTLNSANKAILKPGGHTLSHTKGSGSLVLKGVPDKSQKPSGSSISSAPTKSPWATLPPIDKVSPVSFAPPVQHPQQQPQQRFSRDPSGFDGFNAAPSPKEMEADDFNRVYGQPRNRELFNSHSGRFEPANDARKNAMPKQEQGYRQPAVLQRPPPGPEPSAAFQTNRSGMDSPSWQRHRTGSMSSAGRRMSVGRSQDTPNDMASSPALSNRDIHQLPGLHGMPSRGWPGASPALSHAVPDGHSQSEMPASDVGSTSDVASAVVSQEEAVAKQNRLMREKIEQAKQAKQRRIEEEEREEKARKERLRLKMEALGATATPSPPVDAKDKGKESLSAKSPQAYKPAQIASPPKPPVPTAEGEVVNYGMMKLHQPHPVKKSNLNENSLMGRGSSDSQSDRRSMYHNDQNQRPAQSPRATGNPLASDASAWRNAPESYSGWGSSSSSNVWGPPETKNRALGNGTFDTSYGRMQGARPLGQVGPVGQGGSGQQDVRGSQGGSFRQIAPGPIGPPSLHQQNHRGHEPLPSGAPSHQTPSRSSQHGPMTKFVDNSNFSNRHSQHIHPSHLREHTKAENQLPDHSLENPSYGKMPGPPLTAKQLEIAARWNALTVKRDPEEYSKSRIFSDHAADHAMLRMDQRESGAPPHMEMAGGMDNWYGNGMPPPVDPPFGSARSGAYGSKPGPIGDHSLLLNGATDRKYQASNVSQAGQRSRFFPPTDAHETSEKSSSPPPPEISSLDEGPAHPNPIVNIPRVPVVKLPPRAVASPPVAPVLPTAPVTTSHTKSASSGPPSDWQARIDDLLRRERGPNGPAGVSAASRAPLDVAHAHTTVSLPAVSRESSRKGFSFAMDTSDAVDSKPSDEDLFDPPEFGSTPTVIVPHKSCKYTSADLPQDKRFRSQHSVVNRQSREIEKEFSTSRADWGIAGLADPKSISAIVKFHWKPESKTFSLSAVTSPARSPTGSRTPSASYRGRRGHESGSHRGSRKPSSQYTSRDTPSPSIRSGNNHGRGRGNGHVKRNVSATAS